MKPRIVSLILVLIFILSSADIFAADTNMTSISYRVAAFKEKLAAMTPEEIDTALGKFPDMGNHWSRPYVGRLTSLEILTGMPDGTFRPDTAMKVDEFIVMTVRALGFKPEMEGKHWTEPYIKIAIDEKLIEENEFQTYTRPILRQEAVKLTVKAAMLSETAPSSSIYNNIRSKIKDYPSIEDDYKQYVLQAYAMGLVSGTAQGFLPMKNLTRGEASTLAIKQLDISLRTPLKPGTDEVLTLEDLYGKAYEIYPTGNEDTFKAAGILCSNTGKSKGYVTIIYNPFDQIINGAFYPDETTYKEKKYNMHMALSIYTLEDEAVEHPYVITVYNPAEASRLHRAVVVEVFNFLFEQDADKMTDAFDKYTELSVNTDAAAENDYICNSRKVHFYRVQNEKTFTIWVYKNQK